MFSLNSLYKFSNIFRSCMLSIDNNINDDCFYESWAFLVRGPVGCLFVISMLSFLYLLNFFYTFPRSTFLFVFFKINLSSMFLYVVLSFKSDYISSLYLSASITAIPEPLLIGLNIIVSSLSWSFIVLVLSCCF